MSKPLILLLILTVFISSVFAQVAINADGSTPHNSAMLDVKSAGKGFLPPRLTHAELAQIVSPADGLVVFCTDCSSTGQGALAMYMNGRWHTLSSNCLLPLPPVAGTHIPSYNQIVWNWNPVADASGYRWNTFNSFATATELGTATTYTEVSLACSLAYNRYIWAYNSCGNSTPVILT